MSKLPKINLILISIIVLGIIGYFDFVNALGAVSKHYERCTGTTNCTSWDICIDNIKTCKADGYSKTPSPCQGGTVLAPTSTCSSSQSTRTASGYAWSDNIGYISFSGSGVVSTQTCIPTTETQSLSCPNGTMGATITQTRTSTCATPTATPIFGNWTPTTNPNCVANCTPTSETGTAECPYGQTGSVTKIRTVTCPGSITSEQIINTTCVEWYSPGIAISRGSDWNTANAACAKLPTAGKTKPGLVWRLPSIDELMFEKNNFEWKTYWWSGTTVTGDPDYAYIMGTYGGQSNTKKTYTFPFTQCAR